MDNKALYPLTCGLYVVGTKKKEGFGGCIVDAFMRAGNDPITAYLCSMIDNETNAIIKKTGEFSLSILPESIDPFIIANFGFQSGREADKWANVPYEVKDGLPYLNTAISYLRCKVISAQELNTHTSFLCEIVDAWSGTDGRPLTYNDYQKNMKSAAADAFKAFKSGGAVAVSEKPANKDIWVCGVCGYEYDGDVPFEELPDDWKCPWCGQPKSVFKKK